MAQRRGVTFLEVVLAAALFSGLTTVLFTGYDALRRWSLVDRERLNATEVAHRLLLIYAHDGPGKMPTQDQYITQGSGRYRFLLSEELLVERDSDRENVTVRNAEPVRSLSPNQRIGAGLFRITIKVYPDESTAITDPGRPLAELSRVFDPFDPGSDDDTMIEHVMYLLQDQDIALPAGALQ